MLDQGEKNWDRKKGDVKSNWGSRGVEKWVISI